MYSGKSNYYIAFFLVLGSLQLTAQSYLNDGNYNRLGFQGKYTSYTIQSDNLNINPNGGFLGGFTSRSRVYNNFGFVYGIDFLTANVDVETITPGTTTIEETSYNIIGAQVNFWPSYDIIPYHLSIEGGPTLQINSRLRLSDSSQEDNIVVGYSSLSAQDISEITRIVPLAGIAISGGTERFRFTVQYQYGFTNILNNLNNQDLEMTDAAATDFTGNVSAISGGLVIYL